MSSTSGVDGNCAVEQLTAALDTLAATDVTTLHDQTLKQQVLDLHAAGNRVQAELVRRIDIVDRRGLAPDDGFRTAKAWLQGAGRLSGAMAHRLVKAARLLRQLPRLAAATQSGEASGEHVQQVSRLADQVGVEHLADVDATLADAARQLEPEAFTTVTERIRAHLDPDGSKPDDTFAKRGLTLSPVAGMMALRGQLDPEGGAALATALDALMTPPAAGDDRTPAQRRADALVDLARLPLAGGTLPTVGGQRPQVALLLYPQALSNQLLAKLADAQRDALAAQRLREFITVPATTTPRTDWTRPGAVVDPYDVAGTVFGRTPDGMLSDPGGATDVKPAEAAEPDGADPAGVEAAQPTRTAEPGRTGAEAPDLAALRASWSRPGWNDPPWLNWLGPIPPEAAQRIACDSDIFRLVLDPATGMPLDVGRSHRLVPYWMRRALYARDRGCRWPGCTVPAEWTDGHHLTPWIEDGETKVDEVCLLCRFHHCLVHDGGWRIDLDPRTGQVHITRPDGTPYHLPRSRSASWNGPTTQAR
jgi:hypothetical protein